jgi:hypothetical protein
VLNPTSPSPALIPRRAYVPLMYAIHLVHAEGSTQRLCRPGHESRPRWTHVEKHRSHSRPQDSGHSQQRNGSPTLETPDMSQSNFIYKYFAIWSISCLSDILMWFLRHAKEYLKLDMIGLFSFAGPSKCAKAVEEATSAKSRSTQSQGCKTSCVF